MIKKFFNIGSCYEGQKKYKILNFLGLSFKFQVTISKNKREFIANSKPKPLDNSIEPKRNKVYLSIVAIFKDEPDIIEWIEYHKLAGIERFYLYDNESITDYEKILKPYIDTGEVVYKKILGKSKQRPAYRDAIYRYKNETEWMAIIDLDEYIVPVSTNDIKDFLKDYEDYCGVVVNWLSFDSNGVEKRNKNKSVIDTFTRVYENYNTPINRTIKSIVKPSKVKLVRSVHACIYKRNEIAVDENFNPIKSNLYFRTNKVSMNKIRINHYHCKSKEEYLIKINKGFADRTKPRTYEECSLNFEETTHDYIIKKYSKELNKKMHYIAE